MIEAIELTSRGRGWTGSGTRRGRPVVDRVSFDVYPGQVTALLGARGVGKSAVLRMMTEQERTKGRTLFNGRPYRALRPAVREVGLALNPEAVHPGRTVRHHLALYAAAGGVAKSRIGEVLEIGGLMLQADTRCGYLDPGQKQRLAIAAALLGDPAALLLDEPHVLDAHGLTWFNALIRVYAAQGRTVLVAASDPEAIAASADHVVMLQRDEEDGRTRVVASRSATDVFDGRHAGLVMVRSPQAARLATVLEADGASLVAAGPGVLKVGGVDRARIGELAHAAGICLHELAEAGKDELFYGIQSPRKEAVPVPTESVESVEAEDVVIGVGAGQRSAWRAGVRLISSVRGGTAVKDVEDVLVVDSGEDGAEQAALSVGVGETSVLPALVAASSEQCCEREPDEMRRRDVVVAAEVCAARSAESGAVVAVVNDGEMASSDSGMSSAGDGLDADVFSPESSDGPDRGVPQQGGTDAFRSIRTAVSVSVSGGGQSADVEAAGPSSGAAPETSRSTAEAVSSSASARPEAYAVELAAAYAQAFVEDGSEPMIGASAVPDRFTSVILRTTGTPRPESEEAPA